MSWFLGGLVFLILGYFTYGKLIERIIGTDDRKTPFLNIAGVGPVLGVILGIKFGKVALLIITVGCVFMGAVHDFFSGVMSFILWTSPAKGQVWGVGLPYGISLVVGILFSLAFAAYAIWRGRNVK